MFPKLKIILLILEKSQKSQKGLFSNQQNDREKSLVYPTNVSQIILLIWEKFETFKKFSIERNLNK